ncbi:MAG: RHS repeat-associated core domain-containing protein [Nanoarchaeota archaeon]
MGGERIALREYRRKRILCVLIAFLIVSVPFALAGSTSLQYDANGNWVSDGVYLYEYDGFNTLIRVRNASDPSHPVLFTFLYDEHGDRIAKKDFQTGVVTHYIGDVLVVVNDSGVITQELYVQNEDGTQLAKKVGDEVTYYHPDHLGSNTLATDASGDEVEYNSYLPFGQASFGGSERFTFTGKESDDFGQYYYGARYYAPNLAVFTSPDSIIQNPYNPQNLNRYAYVLNNPYKYVDPSGNFFFPALFGQDLFFPSSILGENFLRASGPELLLQRTEVAPKFGQDVFRSSELGKTAIEEGFRPLESLSKDNPVRQLQEKFGTDSISRQSSDGKVDILRYDPGHRSGGFQYPHTNHLRFDLTSEGALKPMGKGVLDHFPVFIQSYTFVNYQLSSYSSSGGVGQKSSRPPSSDSDSSNGRGYRLSLIEWRDRWRTDGGSS